MFFRTIRRRMLAGAVSLPLGLVSGRSALAIRRYDPGATDREIRIGHLNPYSGPASAYGTIGRALTAFFDKVNHEGGVRGRRLKFISVDDGYNPAKALEATRRLVEQDEVLLVFNPLGTAPNAAPDIKSTLLAGDVASNNALTFASKLNGAAGNAITIRLVNPGTNNASLSVSVVDKAITVNLATHSGAAVSPAS